MVSFKMRKEMGKVKRLIAVFIVLLAVAMFLTVNSLAGEQDAKEGQKIINANCPVMGGPVSEDTPYKVEYKGKMVGLCCGGCVPAFTHNPEKYAGNLYKDEKARPILRNMEEGGKK